ncbi:MAG: hypothetical protein RBR50_08550 [Candidatus Izemoplasmatales bacterium]|jgi:hypothetical protein|nr:hypothetical protein [Candidatus Izemoplasmatales bacterium]
MIKTKCILYFDLKVNKPIYCCFDGETIYCLSDDGTIKTSTPFAVRDINDSSFAWYKDLNDDPYAYEEGNGLYLFENGEQIAYSEFVEVELERIVGK